MSAGGAAGSATDGGNSAEGQSGDSAGGAASANGKCPMSLTPRFTQEEKEILYSLFHQHEDIIDIKFRKKQRSKYSVRDIWEHIVQEFNSHPGVSAARNLKQIQKFWLNARLRKQYPFRGQATKNANNSGEQQQQTQIVSHDIKDEPEFQTLAAEESAEEVQNESFEEIEMDQSGVAQMEEEESAMEVQQQQQQQQVQQQHHQQQQQQLQQQQLQQHVQHQQQTATIQAQQISVDQISADKLTLNDLLQFKTTRPREEIILQIKHPNDATGAQITIPSPTRITIPTHHQQPQQHTMATITTAGGYNQQIISEIKPQQITLAQYQQQQLQQQQQQLAQQHQQLANQQILVATAQPTHQQQHQQQQHQQQQQQVKMQLQSPAPTAQFTTSTPTFTCTTYNAVPTGATTATPTSIPAAVTATLAPTMTATGTVVTAAGESFEEKINYFKLKEAELRFKEEQLALEKKKIELNRAQDELKHMREIHRLQVEEMKMKIRILEEEEKLMRKNGTRVVTAGRNSVSSSNNGGQQ